MTEFVYEPFPVDCTDDEALFEMPRDEALRIFDAFYQQITWRMVQLALVLRSTPDGVSWPADFSPGSLDLLMQWIKPRIKLVDGCRLELLAGALRFAREPQSWPVHKRHGTDPAFSSLLLDVSIYFAECYRRAEPGFYWTCLGRKCKKMNSPCLVGPVRGFNLTPWINMGHVCVQLIEGRAKYSAPREILEQNLSLPRDPTWASKKRG